MFDSFLGEGMTAIYSSAIYTTLKITLISTLLAYLIGTPLGVLLMFPVPFRSPCIFN